jgi:hypothetical protein
MTHGNVAWVVAPPTRSHTTPVGERQDRARDIVLAVVDRRVGAERAAQLELVVGARRRDHPRAERGAQLDRCRADTARPGVHEERLTGLQQTALHEGEVGDVEGEEERRPGDVVEAQRHLEGHVGVDDRVLRVPAVRAGGGGDHPAAGPVVGSGAGGDDGAEHLHAEGVRQRRVDRAIAAVAAVHLVEVQRGRGHLDEGLAGARDGHLDLLQRERHRRRPVPRDPPRQHVDLPAAVPPIVSGGCLLRRSSVGA